jgi:hypothetical protein
MGAHTSFSSRYLPSLSSVLAAEFSRGAEMWAPPRGKRGGSPADVSSQRARAHTYQCSRISSPSLSCSAASVLRVCGRCACFKEAKGQAVLGGQGCSFVAEPQNHRNKGPAATVEGFLLCHVGASLLPSPGLEWLSARERAPFRICLSASAACTQADRAMSCPLHPSTPRNDTMHECPRTTRHLLARAHYY